MKQNQKLKHDQWQQKQKQENAQSNSKLNTLFYGFHSLNHCFISSKRQLVVLSISF